MRYFLKLAATLALLVASPSTSFANHFGPEGSEDQSWFYVGSSFYSRGARNGGVSFQPIVGTYLGLQASQFCAPRVTGVAASVWDQWRGTSVLVPVRFVSQRYWNGNVEAVYQVAATGYQPVLNGTALNYAFGPTSTGSNCEIRVYVGN